MSRRLRADFNGLFGDILCLSHSDSSVDEDGVVVPLHPGMAVTAFDEDCDDLGRPDDLVASGVVEPSPPWLQCNGSRWVLRIDNNGCHGRIIRPFYSRANGEPEITWARLRIVEDR